MADDVIIAVVQRYLAKIVAAGIPVERCIVFGSHARGEQTVESDIDLLVVSPTFDKRDCEAAHDALWHAVWRVDSRIEPIGVGVREYEKESWKPLLMVARQEGVVIYPDVKATTSVAAEGREEYRTRQYRQHRGRTTKG